MSKAYKCDGCGKLIEQSEGLEESTDAFLDGRYFNLSLTIRPHIDMDTDLCLTCKKVLITEFVATIREFINQ